MAPSSRFPKARWELHRNMSSASITPSLSFGTAAGPRATSGAPSFASIWFSTATRGGEVLEKRWAEVPLSTPGLCGAGHLPSYAFAFAGIQAGERKKDARMRAPFAWLAPASRLAPRQGSEWRATPKPEARKLQEKLREITVEPQVLDARGPGRGWRGWGGVGGGGG